MTAEFDFSGYATKVGLKCADGRTILKDAFKHMHGKMVPMVWQHIHDDPSNILGHAVLEHRDDGVYAYCKFNGGQAAQSAKEAVKHGDINALSIYANQLKEKGKEVIHGVIREVSLVLAGSNPEALIDNLSFAHGGVDHVDASEAVIYTALPITVGEIEHAVDMSDIKDHIGTMTAPQKDRTREELESSLNYQQRNIISAMIEAMTSQERAALYSQVVEALKHGEGAVSNTDATSVMTAAVPALEVLTHAKYADDATVQDVLNTLDDTQKNVVYGLLAQALSAGESVEHSIKEGESEIMKTNVFDKSTALDALNKNVLTHDQMKTILTDAMKRGSIKEAVLIHAVEYGIENIDVLFPEARLIRNTPDAIAREDDWVSTFLSGLYKTPFSRIKTTAADLTEDEARAKGYITGKKKKDEVIKAIKRVTTPTTVYKKQKLDRDDVVDITDFDVVAWIKGEMRRMLDEELARAVLIGDGRPITSEEHIDTECIRPVWGDDSVYTTHVEIPADMPVIDRIDEVVRARRHYKGSGTPNYYTSETEATDMLLARDVNQRRIYTTMEELASSLRVGKVVTVDVMEGRRRTPDGATDEVELVGIMMNPRDYAMGADRGGQVGFFDDFDIDYNQQKYLIETRVSGALTRPKSAVVIEKKTV